MAQTNELCKDAILLALQDKWNEAHVIVQDLNTPLAQRIHAVLHKIEGDKSNSCYWYNRAGYSYDDFINPNDELLAIMDSITS